MDMENMIRMGRHQILTATQSEELEIREALKERSLND